ncbi:hypothetical protein EL75_2122 [Escherichia coli]|nr:hypothetical protein EL75_2122 [Escherichia coli]
MNHKDTVDDGVPFAFFITDIFSDRSTITVQFS